MPTPDDFAPGLPSATRAWQGLVQQAGTPEDVVVVCTTVPDLMLAKRIAHVLVEESLVACAQVGAVVTSMYLWQGKLEGGDEIPLSLKTTAAVLPALYQRLCTLHPYDVPEFLVLGVPAGSAAYLGWVREVVHQPV